MFRTVVTSCQQFIANNGWTYRGSHGCPTLCPSACQFYSVVDAHLEIPSQQLCLGCKSPKATAPVSIHMWPRRFSQLALGNYFFGDALDPELLVQAASNLGETATAAGACHHLLKKQPDMYYRVSSDCCFALSCLLPCHPTPSLFQVPNPKFLNQTLTIIIHSHPSSW